MILEIVGFLVWFGLVSWVVFCLGFFWLLLGVGGKGGEERCGG